MIYYCVQNPSIEIVCVCGVDILFVIILAMMLSFDMQNKMFSLNGGYVAASTIEKKTSH